MEQLLTSWYCPSCGGNTSDVKETPDSSRKIEWELVGTIDYINSHPYGYVIYYILNHIIYTELFIYDMLDYKSNLDAETIKRNNKKGFTLHCQNISKKYHIAGPGYYWKNGIWQYSAYHHFHHKHAQKTP
jgi:hypothetical protein